MWSLSKLKVILIYKGYDSLFLFFQWEWIFLLDKFSVDA